MKRVLVKSVFECFEYVVDGNEGKTYAVISIQDAHKKGFGFQFVETDLCKGVLTLYFDDIERPVEGYVLFSEEQARLILQFVALHKSVDELLIHCYAGQSRSAAVGAFVVKILGGSNEKYFKYRTPNAHVYKMLETENTHIKEQLNRELHAIKVHMQSVLKNERPEIDSTNDLTLEQMYLSTDAKSTVNTITGRIIDILEDERYSPQEKLNLIKECLV